MYFSGGISIYGWEATTLKIGKMFHDTCFGPFKWLCYG